MRREKWSGNVGWGGGWSFSLIKRWVDWFEREGMDWNALDCECTSMRFVFLDISRGMRGFDVLLSRDLRFAFSFLFLARATLMFGYDLTIISETLNLGNLKQ